MENQLEWNDVKILLVDDDEDDYILLRQMLQEIRDLAYEVEWIGAYQEFNQALERMEWDIILMDYDLGGVNGLTLIQSALERGIEVPFIIVTGRGQPELELQAQQLGVAGYLTKNGLTAPELDQAIRSALNSHGAI